MRIDPLRVFQSAPTQRVGEARNAVSRRTPSSVSDTTDLLAISAGVSVSQTREAMVSELKQAYRNGALQPDPARVAERLMQWGFDSGKEPSL